MESRIFQEMIPESCRCQDITQSCGTIHGGMSRIGGIVWLSKMAIAGHCPESSWLLAKIDTFLSPDYFLIHGLKKSGASTAHNLSMLPWLHPTRLSQVGNLLRSPDMPKLQPSTNVCNYQPGSSMINNHSR